MTTRNTVGFELRLSCSTSLRIPPGCQRTFRHVARGRPFSRRECRSLLNRPPLFPPSRASMDSMDTEIVPEADVAEEKPAEAPSDDNSPPAESEEGSPSAESEEGSPSAESEEGSPSAESEESKLPSLPPRKALKDCRVGDVLSARVKHVQEYGVFLDAICEVDVFVHVSDMRDGFVSDAAELLKLGDEVKVELVEVTDRLKGSLKKHHTFPDATKKERSRKGRPTREEEEEEYDPMETFTGFVTEVTSDGAFVSFNNGKASGFLPIEEMAIPDNVDPENVQTEDLIMKNDGVDIRVIETDEATNTMQLSMRSFESVEVEKKDGIEEFFITDGDSGEDAILRAVLKEAGFVQAKFANTEKTGDTDGPSTNKTKVVSQAMTETLETEKSEEKTEEGQITEKDAAAAEEQETVDSAAVVEEVTEHLAPESEESVAQPVAEEISDRAEAELQTKPKQELETANEQEESAANVVASTGEETPKQVDVGSEAEVVKESETTAVDIEEIPEQPKAIVASEEAPLDKIESSDATDQTTKGESMDAAVTDTEEKAVQKEMPEPAAEEKTTSMRISASLVKELRDMSGAGMMDCKKALTECKGDIDAAMEYLKNKGISSAAKRAGKIAADGRIATYIHTGAKLGILLEVNSETDFVARTDAFKEFVDDVALTIAASPDAICISPEDYPSDLLAKEKEVEMGREELRSKPEGIREKIVMGRLEKIKKTASVLEQPFIRDQSTTVQAALTEITASLGEKISIRRFVRYELGEGLEKKEADLAADVADQIESKKAEAMTKPEPTPEASDSEMEPTVKVAASLVKELREMTGGGFMDCKKALAECNGDLEKAAEYLRMKGLASAAKKASRLASEGVICSYIHLGSRLGVMAEINCETDFVARGDVFQQLAEDIAIQIAACPEVEYVSEDVVPKAFLDAELKSEMEKEDIQSKTEPIRLKIAEGRVQKTISSLCLSDQPFLKDTNKTTGEIIKEHIATLGENIKVRRFVRFNLGEGIEKKESNFAEEVAEQMEKRA